MKETREKKCEIIEEKPFLHRKQGIMRYEYWFQNVFGTRQNEFVVSIVKVNDEGISCDISRFFTNWWWDKQIEEEKWGIIEMREFQFEPNEWMFGDA